MSLAERAKSRPNPVSRILTIDIERLPGKAWRFDQKGSAYTSWRQFTEDPRTICWAARWYGQTRMMFAAEWIDREAMIRKSWELYDEADLVVTFNGVGFDDRILRADWLAAGFPPPRPWKAVDLYRVSKQFGVLSHSLDYVSQFVDLQGKSGAYNIDKAAAACAGNKVAQRELKSYNAGDVEVTEALYERLLPWISNHPHVGRSAGPSCNRCGSSELTQMPTRYRAVVLTYDMFRCDKCEGIVRTNFNAVRIAQTTGVKS